MRETIRAPLCEVRSIDRRVVESTDVLREALDEMLGKEGGVELISPYIVTLYEETLCDGVRIHCLGIHAAERV
jgi:hypothetical protein